MREPPPPFYSRSRNRTRPGHRRAAAGPEPDVRQLRSQLSRASVILAAFITIVGIGSVSLQRTHEAGPLDLPVNSDTTVGVQVARIIDGDTLDVVSAATTIRVRLYGVDTPERGEQCFAEAIARLAALAGDRVILLPDARSTDSFGRELRYVFTSGGESIDEALVRGGFAVAWREDGSRRAALIAAEDAARDAHTGCLWTPR